MKKNLVPIVALVAFILAWNFFVIRPYNEKNKKIQEAQKQATQSTKPIELNKSNSQQISNTLPTSSNSAQYLSEKDKEQFVEVALSDKRSLRLYSGGAIGTAVLKDYNVREQIDVIPVSLMLNGLKWSSSDADVDLCLKNLRGSPSNKLAFQSSEKNGSCELQYTLDTQKIGLLSLKLTLKGFTTSKGFIEFKGSDSIGPGSDTDLKHLLYSVDDSKKEIRDKKLFEVSAASQGKVTWLAWGERYFATILLPKGNYNPNVVYGPVDPLKKDVEKDETFFGFQYPIFNPGSETIYDLDLMFTQRDSSLLMSVNPDLKNAVELGFFPAISRALIFAIKLLHKVVGNYGLAIILLTLIVRFAFWPLNKKVFESSQKMKNLAPEMEKIKQKFGNDKSRAQEQNLEVMALYKRHKVNPMGSCLPMLFQLPIWFGLYQALNHSLDLYQAPFYGWITDLSARDPYFIFPVLWTISMMLYMWLNPTPTQPGQPDMKWMMMAMNVFIGYMSRTWPAGLTIYLLVSNLVQITQQLVMMRAHKKLQPIQEGA